MLVKRFAEAKPYDAPNHRGVVGLRLQGFEPARPARPAPGHDRRHIRGAGHGYPGQGAGRGAQHLVVTHCIVDVH